RRSSDTPAICLCFFAMASCRKRRGQFTKLHKMVERTNRCNSLRSGGNDLIQVRFIDSPKTEYGKRIQSVAYFLQLFYSLRLALAGRRKNRAKDSEIGTAVRRGFCLGERMSGNADDEIRRKTRSNHAGS